jgi:lipid-binding SYLF domain-containing protein
MRMTKIGLLVGVLSVLWIGSVQAADQASRLRNATSVLDEMRGAPDKGVSEELWNKAECVAVIPSVKKAAFIVGGEYGKGVLSCRAGKSWSAPVFIELEKGSWGFQVGAQEIDLVLLVMNRRGVEKLLESKVALGADASVAAGPVGRSAAASTDAQMSAEILSYSRAHGLFAGIDISGGVLKPDNDANKEIYGDTSAHDVLLGGKVPVPAVARDFQRSLSREFRATTGRR